MMNPFKEVNWSPNLQERRKFALSILIGFPCLALALLLVGYLSGKGWNVPLALKVGAIGVAGLLFLALPAIARPFYVVWYFVACCVGFVVGNVLLAVVFYGFIAVMGLAMRAAGRRAIRKRFDSQAKTYWQDAEQPSDPREYYRQF